MTAASYGDYLESLRVEKRVLASAVRTKLRRFSQRHSRPVALLDAGCGDGTLMRLVSDSAAKVLAVERNEALVETCRQRMSADCMCKVEIVHGNWLELEWPSRFNVFLFSHVLYHLNSADELLAWIARFAAKPNMVLVALRAEESVTGQMLPLFWPKVHGVNVPGMYFIEGFSRSASLLGVEQEVTYHNAGIWIEEGQLDHLLPFIFSCAGRVLERDVLCELKDWLLPRLNRREGRLWLPTKIGMSAFEVRVPA